MCTENQAPIVKIEKPSLSPWNSLERTKIFLEVMNIVFSIFIPIAILYVGKDLKVADAKRENEARVIALRFDTYQKLSDHLNNIYTYFTFRGQWKEFTPIEIIYEKRCADKTQAINQHLFSDEFNNRYKEFIKACFAESKGAWGKDALLKTTSENRKKVKPTTRLSKLDDGKFTTFAWDKSWDSLFITEKDSFTSLDDGNKLNRFGTEVETKYNELNKIIAAELKLKIDSEN